MRKTLGFILVIALVTFLVGCSGDGEQSRPATSEAPGVGSSEVEELLDDDIIAEMILAEAMAEQHPTGFTFVLSNHPLVVLLQDEGYLNVERFPERLIGDPTPIRSVPGITGALTALNRSEGLPGVSVSIALFTDEESADELFQTIRDNWFGSLERARALDGIIVDLEAEVRFLESVYGGLVLVNRIGSAVIFATTIEENRMYAEDLIALIGSELD